MIALYICLLPIVIKPIVLEPCKIAMQRDSGKQIRERPPSMEEMMFGLHEVVFAKCQNYKPWPAQIIKVSVGRLRNSSRDQYIYKVKFFGSTSFSDHCTSELQKFDEMSRTKYERLYSKTKNKEEKEILKSIQLALKRQQQNEAILKATTADPLLLTGLVPLPALSCNIQSPNPHLTTSLKTETIQDVFRSSSQDKSKSKFCHQVAKKSHPIYKSSSQKSKKKKPKGSNQAEKESSHEKCMPPTNLHKDEEKIGQIVNDLTEGGDQIKCGKLSHSRQLYSQTRFDLQYCNSKRPALANKKIQDTPTKLQINSQSQSANKGTQAPISSSLTLTQPVNTQSSQQRQQTANISINSQPQQSDGQLDQKTIKEQHEIIDQLIGIVEEQRIVSVAYKPSVGIAQEQEQQEQEIVDEQTGQVIRLNVGYSDRIIGLESHIDELEIEDHNYLKLFKLLKTRKMMLEGRCPQELLSLANRYLEKMSRQVGKPQPTLMLSMKQKQVLMAILSCQCIDIRSLLRQNTIVKINQFVLEYQRHDFASKKHYEMQYEFMRGKLRLYLAALSRSLPVFRLGAQKEQEYIRMMKNFSKML